MRLTPWRGMSEILAAIRDHDRVAVRAGRKVSKSASGAVAALWWAVSGGKVLVTAPTAATLDDPFWLELRHLVHVSRLPIIIPQRPSTAIRVPTGGRIIGRTAAQRENLQGPSGAQSLYIIEEASGVKRDIIEAIEGNVAGGGKILMLGNPTQLAGAYYDAFHKDTSWHRIHLSSRDSPNVTAGRVVIPGLAIPEWIEEQEEKHGKDSPFVQVHVDGDFPSTGANSVIPLALIEGAQEAWSSVDPTTEEGELRIGLDVARSGDDESVIQPVRGRFAHANTALRNQTGPSLGAAALDTAQRLRRGAETITINVDIIGVGASAYDWLTEHAPEHVNVRAVNVASKATTERHAKLRDQLAFGLREWLEDGGVIPPGADEVRSDAVALTYSFDTRGKYKVTSKDELKSTLGRSPDHGDALMLAIYQAPDPFVPSGVLGWD